MKRKFAIFTAFLGMALLCAFTLKASNWLFLNENTVHEVKDRTNFPVERIINPMPNSEYYSETTTTYYEKKGRFPFVERKELSSSKRVMQHLTRSEKDK